MIRYLFALALLLVTAMAQADSHRHVAWTRAVLGRVAVFHEDREAVSKAEQLDELARAIADVSRDKPLPPQKWAALLVTVGYHESGFAMRIIANRCKPTECDRGRARGFGQVHANALNRQEWTESPGNVALQAKLTSDALARAYWNCKRSGVEAVRATLSSYAGMRCGAEWPGLELRMATYSRLIGRSGT